MNIKELSADTQSIIIGSIISIILIIANVPLLAWFFGPVTGAFTSNYLKRPFNLKYSFMIGLDVGVVFVVASILYSLILSSGNVNFPHWSSLPLIIGGLLLRVLLAAIYGIIGGLIAYISLRLFNTAKKSDSSQ